MTIGRIYNPTAVFVAKRKALIDWMCTVGEELSYQSEAIHHSIAIFDSYYSIPNIEEFQRLKISSIIQGKT